MEYFRPGLRELRRIAGRSAYRVRLALARRRLAVAETELGLLGWQQADFDEHTERQVDEIQHVEREQARLQNTSAELAHRLQALTAERTRLREEHNAQRAQIEPERDRLRALLAEVEGRLASLHKLEGEKQKRAEAVRGEQRKEEKKHNELLAIQPQTPQVRGELIAARDRQFALVEELAELDRQHSLLATDIGKEELEEAKVKQQCATLDDRLRELAEAAETADAKLADEVRDVEKEKARVAADAEKLESAKLHPYREIGRVLADSGVAPANQPEALGRVRTLRHAVESQLAAIAASHALTAHEDSTQLRISLSLLAVIAVALVLLVATLL